MTSPQGRATDWELPIFYRFSVQSHSTFVCRVIALRPHCSCEERRIVCRTTKRFEDAMPDAANIGPNWREEAAPTACSVCWHVQLMLFTLSAGKIEHARLGCLCRSMVVRSEAKQQQLVRPFPSTNPGTARPLPAGVGSRKQGVGS